MGEFRHLAFDGVVTSPLQGRQPKPRSAGHTMVIDKGLGLSQMGDLLELAAEYIDYVKLGFGTAALYPSHLLRAKIGLIRSYGIEAYPGGTFLEVAVIQDAVPAYLERAMNLGFTCVEVSDGTISLPPDRRFELISMAKAAGFQVISEVGKKDAASELDPEEALAQIRADLAAGASKVILEGRESGAGAGIYDKAGRLKAGPMERIVAGVADPHLLMWEAPLKAQQEEFIGRFGPNVNLGNIAPTDVLALEALRTGLRGDTLRLALDRFETGAGGA